MNFAERLKILREKKKASQTQVADMLQVSRQAYNNYERAIREPDFETVKKLAEYFGVSTDYLIGNTDDPAPPSLTKKSDAEEIGDALRKICIDEGMIASDEKLTDEFKEILNRLTHDAVILYKHSKKG